MLRIQDMVGAIRGLLQSRYAGEMVYTNLVPEGFERPSALLETEGFQMADASCNWVQIMANLKITMFVKTDEYYHSHLEELERRMMGVMELFAVGYLEVGDRCLHVTAISGQAFFDYAEIKLRLEYQDDRPGGTDWPLMAEVQTELKGGFANGTS